MKQLTFEWAFFIIKDSHGNSKFSENYSGTNNNQFRNSNNELIASIFSKKKYNQHVLSAMLTIMNDVYLKFLQINSSLETHLRNNNYISPLAMLLLNALAVKDFEKISMTVSDVIDLKELGSPSTLLRKLDELLKAEMITITYVGKDLRRKYIFLTQTAKDHFQFNSDVMLKICTSN